MKKTIKTWKEFWELYMEKQNLTKEDFEDLCGCTDVMFDAADYEKWYEDPEFFWKLYNSTNEIVVKFDEDDGVNENDFMIAIYDGDNKYIVPVCTPDAEDAPAFLPYM